MITTIEELEALPDGSVIKSRNDWVLVKDSPGWWSFGFESYPAEVVAQDVLPAKLLIPNRISQEKFEEAVREFQKPRRHTNGSLDGMRTNLVAALKMLGIEVSDV